MVQSKIQAAQNPALGSQKLGLGEGASAQEAEGGGLWMGGGGGGKKWEESWTLAVIPCLGFGSVPVLDLSFLFCKMGPLICCLEVVENRAFRVRKTWFRVRNPTTTSHRVAWTFTEVLRHSVSLSVKRRFCSYFSRHF